ncbi:MAG: hypothetical protein ACREMN_11540 [Gemmatimonadales bacterium]
MRRKVLGFAAICGVAAAVAVACVSTKATILDPTVRAQAVCPDAVVVFTSADKVGKPYTEVALLNSSGDTDMTSESGMINSQRKKAASLGANGLILSETRDAGTGAKVAQALLGTSANRKGKAVAIYIPDDTARVRQACSAVHSN